jgi:hypothetical protein
MSTINAALEDFMAFTYVFQYCRPKDKNYLVYNVDAGLPTDYNMVMQAAVFEDDKMISDPAELIVAKEWVLENLEEILKNVPDPETTGV